MPRIRSRRIGLAADMFGCPNRCRHCYIGHSPNGQMTETDLRWVVDLFRRVTRPAGNERYFDAIDVATWNREPDFSDDYRILYDLEIELSDKKTYRADWQLMSEWRLARDETYAPWAKSIGVETCQTTIFGIGETQDWFYRRRGAFDDCIIGTERLLDAGIKPRWQVFFTTKIIPEFDSLMRLIDQLRLRERCEELGGEFVMFIHTPTPEGEGRFIEHLRPTIDDVSRIPVELIETERHNASLLNWKSVGDRISEIFESEIDYPYAWSYPEMLWFIIKPGWDVYSNMGTNEPWWKLGNLCESPLEDIIRNFEDDRSIALRTLSSVPLRELAQRYGDAKGRLIDGGVENLWLAQYCSEIAQPYLPERQENQYGSRH